jgi:hypothetical protein
MRLFHARNVIESVELKLPEEDQVMTQRADNSGAFEDKHIAPDAVPNSLPVTSVNPGAIVVALAAASYLLAVFWVTFAGGETWLDLAVVTLTLVIMFGLTTGRGALARIAELDRKSTRSFRG